MLDRERIQVLCTTEVVSYLVKEIGGERIHVYTLIPPLADPHSYQMLKGDDELFESARLLFFSGLGLEYASGFQRYRQSSKAISLGEKIAHTCPERLLYVGGIIDPHLWMDLSLWAEGASSVADALSALLPEQTDFFHERAETLKKRLIALHQKIEAHMKQIDESRRYLVTTHASFRYFVRAYMATEGERASGEWEKRTASLEGLAPDSQISTQDMRAVVSYCVEHEVDSLFSEFGSNRSSLMRLQEALIDNKREAHIVQAPLFADSPGPSGSAQDNYEDMVYYDAAVIEHALSLKNAMCELFSAPRSHTCSASKVFDERIVQPSSRGENQRR